jgi:hypothetical protein
LHYKRRFVQIEKGYEFWRKKRSLELKGSGFKQETKGGNIPKPLVMMKSSLLFHVISLFTMIC